MEESKRRSFVRKKPDIISVLRLAHSTNTIATASSLISAHTWLLMLAGAKSFWKPARKSLGRSGDSVKASVRAIREAREGGDPVRERDTLNSLSLSLSLINSGSHH